MNCEHFNTCSFIQHMSKIQPFTVNIAKIKYCDFNSHKCARFRLAKICHMENIPFDLSPVDGMKALELLESKLNENPPDL